MSLTVLLALASVAPAGAESQAEYFGAALTTTTQPQNCCPPHECVTPAALCTWIMNGAYNNSPGGEKAPHDGTINQIRLIAGFQSGSFQLFIARAKPNQQKGKVIFAGPTINYNAQPDGNSPYVIQTFTVNIAVHTNDRLAIKASTTNILRCNNGSPNTFQFVPRLVVGGPFADVTDTDGCYLLLQARYA